MSCVRFGSECVWCKLCEEDGEEDSGDGDDSERD